MIKDKFKNLCAGIITMISITLEEIVFAFTDIVLNSFIIMFYIMMFCISIPLSLLFLLLFTLSVVFRK